MLDGAPTFTLADRYTNEHGQVYLSGLQALVRLLVDQRRADRRLGLNTGTLVSGYPGSPIGTLDVELGRQRELLATHDIVFVPGLNEELAATAVFGSQLMQSLPDPKYDGVVGMWFGKAPGVDRTVDAFRHGAFRGVSANGGVVAVAGDDPSAKSSIQPSDSLLAFADLMMPMVYPSDVQGIVDLGLHAFALSRASGQPAGLKLVTEVADGAGTALVDPDRVRPIIPAITFDGEPFAPSFAPNRTGRLNLETERVMMHGRLALAREYGRENELNRVIGAGSDARIGFIAPGKTYLDLMEALHELGIEPHDLVDHGIRVMNVGLPHPMHPQDVCDFAAGLRELVIFEEKRPFIETFVKETLFSRAERPRVIGKTDEEGREAVQLHGFLTPTMIAGIAAARLDGLDGGDLYTRRLRAIDRDVVTRPVLPIVRLGHFCSGCPHTTSLKTPDGMVVGGGIGCHTMAVRMGRPEFGDIIGLTQMGGEGAQWIGVAPFTGTSHFFQNLGDGTFAHSGSLAIRFAVAAKVNITYKLLFNSAVAMTGGQDIQGGKVLFDTVRLLEAEGVKKVVITTEDTSRHRGVRYPALATVRDRGDILDVQRELAAVEGVTVLIHDQRCAIEKRRMRRKGELPEPAESVYINESVCEGCGDCGTKSSCLSVVPVDTEFGRRTQIHQSSCTKDFSCLQGDCPSFLTVKPATRGGMKVTRRLPRLPDVEIGEPVPLSSPEHFEVVLSGIGGTGVVTVNQILGTAATMDGRAVRILDLFGGSQKAGAISSNLKVSSAPFERSSVVGPGAADLMLVFDVLVGTEPEQLEKADPSRTVAVVSTDRVATGAMITDSALSFPKIPLFAKAIDNNTRASDNVYVDAERIAEDLLGNALAANLFLTGVAFQKGLIPLPSQNIEHAIRLNGVAVETNLAAFRWGRLMVCRPELVQAALAEARPAPPERPPLSPQIEPLVAWSSGELRRLLEVRAGDLLEYQDLAYARSYVDFVRRASDAEAAISESAEFSEAVARGLYKLMAYKDEYEVARLHLAESSRAAVESEFGPGAKVYWHLHPPVLRSLGMKRKLVLGPWFTPALRTLRGMRGLRGTRADIFGYSKVRRRERDLIDEYRREIGAVVQQLNPAHLAIAVELAGLPDMIRGYEDIKLRNADQYTRRQTELLASLRAPRETGRLRSRAGGV